MSMTIEEIESTLKLARIKYNEFCEKVEKMQNTYVKRIDELEEELNALKKATKTPAPFSLDLSGFKKVDNPSLKAPVSSSSLPPKKEPIDTNSKEAKTAKEGIELIRNTLIPEQQPAFDILMSGKNTFLSGEAGAGKSFVLRAFIDALKILKKNVLITAPTGVAAINVGGTTLHRAFKAPTGPIVDPSSKSTNNVVKSADVIIIDEISMCRQDLFSFVGTKIKNAYIKTGKQIQVVVVGDFFQLPPVITNTDKSVLGEIGKGFAFQSPLWQFFKFTPVILTKVVRQDDINFITNLNKIRVGDKSGIDWINANASPDLNDGIYLCGVNKLASDINLKKLEELDAEEVVYDAEETGIVSAQEKATDEHLSLKVGAKVMFLINDSMGRYTNGSLGVIKKCCRDYVIVNIGDTDIIVQYHTWEVYDYEVVRDGKKAKLKKVLRGSFSQLPLRLAYAITIHKSQGQTYDKVNLYPDCFECGQLYVALSRATSTKGLHLMSPLSFKALRTAPEVLNFYRSLV